MSNVSEKNKDDANFSPPIPILPRSPMIPNSFLSLRSTRTQELRAPPALLLPTPALSRCWSMEYLASQAQQLLPLPVLPLLYRTLKKQGNPGNREAPIVLALNVEIRAPCTSLTGEVG